MTSIPNRITLSLITALAMLSAGLSLQAVITETAWATSQQEPGETSQNFGTQSEIVVPPWCNWILNLPQSIVFEPVDEDGDEIANFIYSGEAQDIQSTESSETYYVAGQAGLTSQAEPDNCSWFNEPEVGAAISYSLSGSVFVAWGRNPITGNFDVEDPGMDIELDSDNPMNFTRIFDDACSDNGFVLSPTGLGLTEDNLNDVFLVSLSPGAVTTNNFCSATTQYSMKIPANLTPYISNTRYVWYGPTITFTAVLSISP